MHAYFFNIRKTPSLNKKLNMHAYIINLHRITLNMHKMVFLQMDPITLTQIEHMESATFNSEYFLSYCPSKPRFCVLHVSA